MVEYNYGQESSLCDLQGSVRVGMNRTYMFRVSVGKILCFNLRLHFHYLSISRSLTVLMEYPCSIIFREAAHGINFHDISRVLSQPGGRIS